MATTEKSSGMCTKCGENPKVTGESWCQPCRTEDARKRRESQEWRTERRGILRGMKAMRDEIARYFRQYGGRPFMGAEVAGAVEIIPGPAVAPEDAKQDQP